jgi:hypothetical protein
MSLLGIGKAPGAGAGSASFCPVYADAQDLNFGATTYTSPSQTWTAGTALVSVYDGVNRGGLAVTINGVGATQVGSYGGSTNRGSLWKATVSAGLELLSSKKAGRRCNLKLFRPECDSFDC